MKKTTTKTHKTYWLTPRGRNKPCSHCPSSPSVAYRPNDHRRACADCIERLGINARESRAWKDGGSRAGAEVRVYRVAPSEMDAEGDRKPPGKLAWMSPT